MGNVCCTGRGNFILKERENNFQINSKNKPLEDPEKTQNPFFERLNFKQISELQRLKIKKLDQFEKNQKPTPKHSADYDSTIGNEVVEKSNTLQVLSYKSEEATELDYNLILTEDLTKDQKLQITSVLDRYKYLITENEQEIVDGLINVSKRGENLMMMITTHAIYLLDSKDYCTVINRVRLEDLILIVLSKTKDTLLFVVKNLKDNFYVNCEDIENLLKGLQQVSYDAFQQYLPWITVNTSEEVYKMQSSMPIETETLLSDEHIAIIKSIVEHGNIGETKLLTEYCPNNGKSKIMNLHFIMTDQAIYTLDSSYGFKNRFMLAEIEKIIVDKENNYVIIYEPDGAHEFSLPLKVTAKIKKAASQCGKRILILYR
jgi:hypothetical protein